jgi:hypothetical protein
MMICGALLSLLVGEGGEALLMNHALGRRVERQEGGLRSGILQSSSNDCARIRLMRTCMYSSGLAGQEKCLGKGKNPLVGRRVYD